ncbi:MAG: DUF6452 family protein [bacterium]
MLKKILFFYIYLSCLLTSCSDELCRQNTGREASFGFYTIEEDKILPATVNFVSVRGLGFNDNLIDSAANKTSVAFPPDILSDTTSVIFTFTILERVDTCYTDTISDTTYCLNHSLDSISYHEKKPVKIFNTHKDTVKVIHEREITLVSHACGYTYNFFITSVKHTNNLIDSIRINEKMLNGIIDEKDEEKHLDIYF